MVDSALSAECIRMHKIFSALSAQCSQISVFLRRPKSALCTVCGVGAQSVSDGGQAGIIANTRHARSMQYTRAASQG